ncbi:ubiquitin-2 like Rad60 SUMO-like-domain-containing protein [Mucor mucedo]|uniref:ubiquitin-2 like Rad60 SUMO-like-domain-containing protein n=1 Tax=Mucor mucedo TaxID=29922 RepID=UPI002221048A|nr:ubiquitin-2 like Rad60 SUMO-like-domain-containing protein [Mucor mucedo]KAI7882302.1 ubiquitin-2 like Rad60 SUMO-like-domain-containing protein [Mucor mucedo]
MSDFDIASLKNASTFAASLQKRKAMGLMDSDSEDEAPKKKTTKPTQRKSSPVRNMAPTKEAESQENNDQDIINNNISTTAEYIAAAEALMAQPIRKASREQPKKKPTATKHSSQVGDLIELSDEEEKEEEIAMPGTDIEDLDPELAALMNESTSTSSTQPLKVTVRLHYVHSFEVTTERAQEILKTLMKPVKVILMDNEQFRKVLDSYCAKKNLKSSDVVLTYNDDQIFLSGTPAGLGMDDIQIYNMHVYSTQSYNAMLEKKKQQKLERMNRYAAKQAEEEDYEEEDIVPSAPPVEESESEKILLKLRGKDKKDITLRVRPTATLSSLLNSYKQHAGVTGNVNLSFEGEVLDLDLTIEDTELEDEDLIEVV